jgi:hypothetical protein
MSPSFLAQVFPGDGPTLSPALWDLLLVGGVTFGLAVVIFIVVAIARRNGGKQRKRSRRGPEILQNSQEHLQEQEARESRGSDEDPRERRRKKRRRRDHRPRNATLAEAGGLPPERDPGTPPNAPL